MTLVSRKTISKIENGKFKGSIVTLERYMLLARRDLDVIEKKFEYPQLDELKALFGVDDDMKYANNFLHDAAVDGDLYKVRFALEHLKAEIDSDKGFALYQACKNGHFYVVQYLISHGADPQANGGRAFFWACELFNFEIVDYFFDYKLVTDKMFKLGLESLLVKHEFEFAKHFITKRNQFESDALLALITACEFSIPEFVKELLDLGVDPDPVLELKLNIDDEVNDILLAYSNRKKLARTEADHNTIIDRDPSL